MLSDNKTLLNKDSLYQLIAMTPSSLNRGAMSKAFGGDEETDEQIDALLNELSVEAKIKQDGKRGYYRATTPWADIAYAVVGRVPPGAKRVPIRILNIPSDIKLDVTISRADVHKHGLKEGRSIVIGLDRGNSTNTGLRARFMGYAEMDRPFQLKGIFNQKSGEFSALDRTIRTIFRPVQEPATTDDPQRHFSAELPTHFDIRFPQVAIIDDQARSHIVACKYGIVTTHSEAVLKEAELLSRKAIDFGKRADLRDLAFVTVDPMGAKDLDDAFYAESTKTGFALYTAIADVASLVTYNSVVDREAYQRGITFYLSNNHIAHMLPSALSTHKSSLVPNEDRLAVVVRQSLDWKGALQDFEVFSAVIRSREKLSYGQFYDLLERNAERFRTIAKIHELRRHRSWNPQLDTFLKDSADKYTSKSIVETLMVQTNSLVAQFLQAANTPFLSRNFAANGAEDTSKNGLTQRAYYASHQLGHASLGLKHYAHVTSPIRRYADIVNLRAVHKVLGRQDIGISEHEASRLDEIATHLNNRRKLDRDVMRDIQKYYASPDLAKLQP